MTTGRISPTARATGLLLLAVLCFVASQSMATPSILGTWTSTYPASTLAGTYSCTICHTSPPSLDPYGTDILNAGTTRAGIQSVESRDSDGDGYTNIAEINANTLPGDATSHPTMMGPTADFSCSPTSGPAPLMVTFMNQCTGGPTSWSWDFGDGGTSTEQNPVHTYTAAGAYTVALTATNSGGSDTATKVGFVTVTASQPSAPAADFSATPALGTAPLSVAFSDLSTGPPTAWAWSFGDGATGTTQNPTHQFVAVGTYTVTLTATNAIGSDTKTKSRYVQATFADVPAGFWALQQILACVDAKIVAGFPDGTYGPAATVSRDQMAVYIARALEGGDDRVPAGPAAASFSDVPTDHWAFRYVEDAKAQGVVQGYPDGTYKPADAVTRDQMAVYISRAIASPVGEAGLAGYTPPATPDFPDVAPDFWAYRYVEYAKEHGVVQGYPDGYHPGDSVTRDQMAVYVQRAFALPM